MGTDLRTLIVDDSEADAGLLLHELRGGGYTPRHARVDTAEAMAAQLAAEAWDVLLLDVKMPSFSAMAALELLRSFDLDLPAIIVSGEVGEEAAAALMRAGAHDYLKKGHLERLNATIARELREVEVRRQRKRAAEALGVSERELSLRNRFADVFLTVQDEGAYSAVLTIILEHTGNPLGLFGYLDDDGTLVIAPSPVDVWDQCRMTDKSKRFPREIWGTGLWGRAIAEERSLFQNAPGRTPDGHVIADCALATPIVCHGTVIGVFVVANKTVGYCESDALALEHMASLVAFMLDARLQRDRHDRQRRKAEEALSRSLEQLRAATEGIIKVMVQVVEVRDPYTAGHQRRVAKLATAIAIELGLSQDVTDGLHYASVIHDIGKISLPAEILSKPMLLSPIEMKLVQTHPASGFEILKDIEFPWPVAAIILQHHERFNGSGYPGGLRGEEILLEARILGVADTVDAIASHRPYRPALGPDAALEELTTKRGVLYDPVVVDVCCRLINEQAFLLTDER
ncbi:MAG: HD domain-containing protein [Acidobacteria bacterium]|nr:HD domain-containing protein [Acidobacteriota bacterium]